MSYGIEWNAGFLLLGAALLLLLVPGFALIAVVVVALAAIAALIALAAAIIASPYLLVRTLRRRHATRQHAAEESLPEARPTAGALTALAN
jgi:hypothetical protein